MRSTKAFSLGNFKYYFSYFSITTFMVFLIFEIIIRSLTFSTGSGLGSASERWLEKYWLPINNLGYRDYDLIPNDLRKSIIFLGDSFTAGQGVKFDETFFYHIAQSLDKNYRAVNLGQPGASTIDQINNLSKFSNQNNLNLDTLIIQYFGNDIEDYAEIPIKKRNIIRRVLSNVSELYSFFDSIYIAKKWNQEYMDSLFLSYQDQNIMKTHLNEINQLFISARKNNARIIFLAFPFLNNNENMEKSEIYISQLKEFFINNCSDKDYFLDISPLAKSIESRKRVVSFLDAHPSVLMHKEVGSILTLVMSNQINELDRSVFLCNK